MNETGSYPGQPWLWLYTMWYQIPGWTNSANIDMIAIYMTGLATLLLLAVPFLPGLRDIPRLIPLHRLVWRSWYARPKDSAPDAGPVGTATAGGRSSGPRAAAGRSGPARRRPGRPGGHRLRAASGHRAAKPVLSLAAPAGARISDLRPYRRISPAANVQNRHPVS